MANARGARTCATCGARGLDLLSPWRLLSNALIHLYYADRCQGTGGRLGGVAYADALAQLPSFRPYRPWSALPWRSFIDQCYLVTHVVRNMS